VERERLVVTAMLLVSHPRAIERAPGGLQLCTDEFIRAFRAGGFDVELSLIEHDRRLTSRLRNRVIPQPYPPQWQPQSIDAIVRAAEASRAQFVCLNLVNLAPLAAVLRPLLPPATQIVLLSHGLESVDYLHTVPAGWAAGHERALGRRLLDERAQRAAIDHVLCLTPFEAEIERWLGARRVTAVPRTIAPLPPLCWKPRGRRIGFVGTLDHPPTRDGLGAFLAAAAPNAPADLEVRIVGGPDPDGQALAAKCPMVRYLGPLDDEALRVEVETWSVFAHPLFCWARGCSTKLAVALAWHLPVVTTAAGARGYSWTRGELVIADHPGEFAAAAIRLTSRPDAEAARRAVVDVVRTSPTIEDVGALLRNALTAPACSAAAVR
jgi:glycosyltransferase involved in cell wall biosynthesis